MRATRGYCVRAVAGGQFFDGIWSEQVSPASRSFGGQIDRSRRRRSSFGEVLDLPADDSHGAWSLRRLAVDRLSMRRRHQLAMARVELRRPMSDFRLLPDFLVIGAMRGGTSSLYKYLSGHREVIASLRKETSYFSRHFYRGEGWYRAHFPLAAHRRWAEAHDRRLVTFEADPGYLVDPRAPGRAAQLLPRAKIVAVLRDPVDRAVSHHQHMVRLGFEPLSFADAVAAEDSRIEADLERLSTDTAYHSARFERFSYLHRGFYAPQLDRWLAHYPRPRILVIRSEDLFHEPVRSWTALMTFLDLDVTVPRAFANHSYRGGGLSDRPQLDIPSTLRAELDVRFRDDATQWPQMVDVAG